MNEKVDKGSHYGNLRDGRPLQERWARRLHQEAGDPEGPCGFEELQDHLGPQGYQLIVVEPSKFLIVFKDATFNDSPHFIALVKPQNHYDGVTSIPALINRSYYCRHCDKAYDREDARHHNCPGQNCPACCRRNKTCPNYAAWIKPTLNVLIATVYFMVKIVLMPTRSKKRRKGLKAFVKGGGNV